MAAADFALVTPTGETLRLSELRGKIVLLNFWATWCLPCRAEMPDLEAIYREFGDELGFVVIGINHMESAAPVADYAQRNNLSFPLLLDTDARVASELFEVRYLPVTILIDREGYIRDTWRGQIAREAMRARVLKVR